MQFNADRQGFTLNFRATEMEAREGIRAVATQLRQRGLSEDRAGDVEIALAEAINNVVEHAYADIEPGQVRIRCQMRSNKLLIRISDQGRPLPDGQLPKGEPASVDTNLADLPEGGFGWFLIQQLVSEIRYERRQNSNLLSLRFDLPKVS